MQKIVSVKLDNPEELTLQQFIYKLQDLMEDPDFESGLLKSVEMDSESAWIMVTSKIG